MAGEGRAGHAHAPGVTFPWWAASKAWVLSTLAALGRGAMPSRAQQLRRLPTPAEVRFWRLIEPIRREWHFRKQAAMGQYVVDFISHKARLIVEIDGDTHFVSDGLKRDQRRDTFLASEGYRVLHFTNDDVMMNPEGVYLTLVGLKEQNPLPSFAKPVG